MNWLEPVYPVLPLLAITLPFAVAACIAVHFLQRSKLPFIAKAGLFAVIYFAAILVPLFICVAAGLWPPTF